MREYIHFFEDSSQRDAYENGTDYTEPYVSYTPIINRYEAQFNGETPKTEFKVEKIQGGYEIQYYNTITGELQTKEVLTNSNSFYYATNFVFPEDLNLTEESTEFTFVETTYYLEYDTDNTWNVYKDSEHTQEHGQISKFDIVSIPSSDTGFVHYNKVPPAKSIYTKIYIENAEKLSKGTDPLYVIISNRHDIFEKIIIDNGADVINSSTQEEQTKIEENPNVYYQFNAYGTHNIEYVLKDEYAGIMPGDMIPSNGIKFDEITLPKGIYKIGSGAFRYTNYTGNYLNLNIPDTINEVKDGAVVCTEISQEVTDLLLSINPNAIYSNCK